MINRLILSLVLATICANSLFAATQLGYINKTTNVIEHYEYNTLAPGSTCFVDYSINDTGIVFGHQVYVGDSINYHQLVAKANGQGYAAWVIRSIKKNTTGQITAKEESVYVARYIQSSRSWETTKQYTYPGIVPFEGNYSYSFFFDISRAEQIEWDVYRSGGGGTTWLSGLYPIPTQQVEIYNPPAPDTYVNIVPSATVRKLYNSSTNGWDSYVDFSINDSRLISGTAAYPGGAYIINDIVAISSGPGYATWVVRSGTTTANRAVIEKSYNVYIARYTKLSRNWEVTNIKSYPGYEQYVGFYSYAFTFDTARATYLTWYVKRSGNGIDWFGDTYLIPPLRTRLIW